MQGWLNILKKSINVFTMLKNKGGKLQIISTDAQKVFNKIQCPFMIKTLSKLEIEGNSLNLIKTLDEKPTKNIRHGGERLETWQRRRHEKLETWKNLICTFAAGVATLDRQERWEIAWFLSFPPFNRPPVSPIGWSQPVLLGARKHSGCESAPWNSEQRRGKARKGSERILPGMLQHAGTWPRLLAEGRGAWPSTAGAAHGSLVTSSFCLSSGGPPAASLDPLPPPIIPLQSATCWVTKCTQVWHLGSQAGVPLPDPCWGSAFPQSHSEDWDPVLPLHPSIPCLCLWHKPTHTLGNLALPTHTSPLLALHWDHLISYSTMWIYQNSGSHQVHLDFLAKSYNGPRVSSKTYDLNCLPSLKTNHLCPLCVLATTRSHVY